MIDVKEARKLTANSEAAIKERLSDIDSEVRKACSEGKTFIEINNPEHFIKPLMNRLNELGYNTHQTHSRGFEIQWG